MVLQVQVIEIVVRQDDAGMIETVDSIITHFAAQSIACVHTAGIGSEFEVINSAIELDLGRSGQ